MKVSACFKTSGNGFWTSKIKSVLITHLEVPYINEDFSHGELRVYFDTNTWNTKEDGLIYTDPGFLENLMNYIQEHFNSNINDVDYSEWGLQGNDYVSLDVGPVFLKFWVDMAVKFMEIKDMGD